MCFFFNISFVLVNNWATVFVDIQHFPFSLTIMLIYSSNMQTVILKLSISVRVPTTYTHTPTHTHLPTHTPTYSHTHTHTHTQTPHTHIHTYSHLPLPSLINPEFNTKAKDNVWSYPPLLLGATTQASHWPTAGVLNAPPCDQHQASGTALCSPFHRHY